MKETTKRTAEEIKREIIEYLTNNKDIFNDCIEELDSYNSWLGDARYYPMEELEEFFADYDPLEILYRAYYGYSEDTWMKDSRGDKKYEAFNPNQNYFYFNGYGNLVSSDYKDYSAYLDRYAIEAMSENRNYIDSIETDETLQKLFDELEEA